MTQVEIDKLIEKVNKKRNLYCSANKSTNENFFSIYDFILLFPYFSQLKVNTLILEFNWDIDIYSKLAELKELKTLEFYHSDLSNTENFIDSISKLDNIESISFNNCKISAFPESLFALKNLEELNINNSLKLPNIQFHTKGNNIRNEAEKIIELIKINSDIECVGFFKWGIKFTDFIICYPSNIVSPFFDVFYLNTLTLYKTLNRILSILNRIDIDNLYFRRINEELYLTICFDGKTYEYFEIKNRYLKGETKIGNQFIDNILSSIGGEELLNEIRKDIISIEHDEMNYLGFYLHNSFIQKIRISNFKLFEVLEIDKLEKINIVLGKNGCGKTSLLQSIALGVIPEYSNNWIPKNVNSYSKYFLGLVNAKNKKKEIQIKTSWENFFCERRYQLDKFLVDKDIPTSYLFLSYGENLFCDPSINESSTISLESGESSNIVVNTLFEDVNIGLRNPQDILRSIEVEYSQENIDLERKETLLELNNVLSTTLNKFLQIQSIEKYEIIAINNEYYFINKYNLRLDLHQLSEGYRTNILLLTDIFVNILSARKKLCPNIPIKDIFKTVKGTILIDEFDKHLHPVWQRKFLSALQEVLPNIQFILTTHNVVALQSAEGNYAYILDENGKIERAQIPVGLSIETLYKKFFNEDYFSEKISEDLKELLAMRDEMIQKNDYTEIESEKFQNLLKKLEVSSQTKMIAKIELNQLLKHKEYAETK